MERNMSCQIWYVFGTLEFAGESEPSLKEIKIMQGLSQTKLTGSMYRKAKNVVVEIPVQAGEKKFRHGAESKNLSIRSYMAEVTQSGIWDIPIMCCLLMIL